MYDTLSISQTGGHSRRSIPSSSRARPIPPTAQLRHGAESSPAAKASKKNGEVRLKRGEMIWGPKNDYHWYFYIFIGYLQASTTSIKLMMMLCQWLTLRLPSQWPFLTNRRMLEPKLASWWRVDHDILMILWSDQGLASYNMLQCDKLGCHEGSHILRFCPRAPNPDHIGRVSRLAAARGTPTPNCDQLWFQKYMGYAPLKILKYRIILIDRSKWSKWSNWILLISFAVRFGLWESLADVLVAKPSPGGAVLYDSKPNNDYWNSSRSMGFLMSLEIQILKFVTKI